MLTTFNSLSIEDAGKNSQTLYFGDGGKKEINTSLFTMPPQAPAGSFDARFASGKMVEVIASSNEQHEFAIHVQPTSSSITLQWELQPGDKRKYALRDEEGNVYPLSRNGGIKLINENSADRVLTLSYEEPILPKQFALQQNYPNPFNPSTKIQYELPVSGFVSIKVYNILGNEVETVVNGIQDAGYHTAVFDASRLPSGVYIYKMQTEKFTSVKKMMLMR